MRTVQDRHILIGRASLVELLHLGHDPFCFGFLRLRKMTEDLWAGGQRWDQFLFDAVSVLVDERVGGSQNLRRGAVVLHHHDGLHLREGLVKIQQVFHICSPPGVNGLVRIAHDKQVLMVAAQDLHQPVLKLINVLKLVDHDILQPLLPLEPDVRILFEYEKGELDEVVIVQAKALFLLVEIAVEDDIRSTHGLIVFFLQGVQRHGDHVPVVLGFLEQLPDLDHVPGSGKGHIPQAQPPLIIDDLEHGVDIRIIQHQKALGILNGMAVFLKNRNAEAVKGVDIAGVIISGQGVDPLAHLICRLVGKGDAEDIAGQDAQLIYQKRKAVGKGPGLAGAGAGNHADKSFCRSNRFPLGRIQITEQVCHGAASFWAFVSFIISGEHTKTQDGQCFLPFAANRFCCFSKKSLLLFIKLISSAVRKLYPVVLWRLQVAKLPSVSPQFFLADFGDDPVQRRQKLFLIFRQFAPELKSI